MKQEYIFALGPVKIQKNDVVLTSSKEKSPCIIRTVPRSDFSHAAICTRPGILIEATTEGVFWRNVVGVHAHRREWIKVFRPKVPFQPNEHGLQPADYAEVFYTHPYTVPGAMVSPFPISTPKLLWEDGSVFCSHLVAKAYLDYGLNLLPGIDPKKYFHPFSFNQRN